MFNLFGWLFLLGATIALTVGELVGVSLPSSVTLVNLLCDLCSLDAVLIDSGLLSPGDSLTVLDESLGLN